MVRGAPQKLPASNADIVLNPAWLIAGKVSRLVLAIISKETREVVERWQFDVALENQKAHSQSPEADAAKENEPIEYVYLWRFDKRADSPCKQIRRRAETPKDRKGDP